MNPEKTGHFAPECITFIKHTCTRMSAISYPRIYLSRAQDEFVNNIGIMEPT
jgi:hypothetical protein